MTYVMLVVGFLLLVKGADYFVEASSSVAKSLRIPSVIVGLTVVAFGTSAPELAVSMTAALEGSNGIAVGNVLGSNALNLLIVLGLCGLISPVPVHIRWDYFTSIGAAVVLAFMMMVDGVVGSVDGILLLVFFVGFILFTIRDAIKNRIEATEEIEVLSPVKSAIYMIGGMIAIVYGGDFVVNSATAIALTFGLSESLVGLTIVAFGTSLPELVTSVIASKKGENGLAVGNVVGSNIFNILMVLGGSTAVKAITVTQDNIFDVCFVIVASILTFLLCRREKEIGRMQGAVMVMLYAVYMVYICIR